MTSSCRDQHLQQLPTRRHFERPTRVWPFVMESLAEKNETEGDSGTHNNSVSSTKLPSPADARNMTNSQAEEHVGKEIGIVQQQQQLQQPQSVGCAPFFGVKHYLHNFYGLPNDESSSKIWRQIEAENEEDYFAILTAGQSKSEVECWHVHRRCFAWSVSLGTVIVIIGMTCLLLGFLLPRHPVLVGQMEENDLKMWIAAHTPSAGHFNLGDTSVTSLNILDRKAVEHNNVLDILKVGGLMGTCLGVLLLVVALIFPPGRHPSTWAEEDDTPQISQINQALKNCLRTIHTKNNLFYSGLVASTTEEKIPVFQQVHSVQPQKN